jgi:hypothetical protein
VTFDRFLAEWMVACDQPFSEVDKPEFRRLLQYLRGAERLSIPSARTIKRHIIDMGVNAVSETITMIKVIFLPFVSCRLQR